MLAKINPLKAVSLIGKSISYKVSGLYIIVSLIGKSISYKE